MDKKFHCFLMAGFILVLLFFGTSKGQDLENDPECEYLKNVLALVRKQIIQMPTCATEVRTSSGRSVNFMVVHCSLRDDQTRSCEDGRVSLTGVMDLMQSVVPPNMKNMSTVDMSGIDKAIMNKCQAAMANVDPRDPTCATYEPLLSCAMDAITGIIQNSIPKLLQSSLGGGGANTLNSGLIRVGTDIIKSGSGLDGGRGGLSNMLRSGLSGRGGLSNMLQSGLGRGGIANIVQSGLSGRGGLGGGGIANVLKSGLGGAGGVDNILQSALSGRINGIGVSPVKMMRCGTLMGRLQGELRKLGFQSLGRMF